MVRANEGLDDMFGPCKVHIYSTVRCHLWSSPTETQGLEMYILTCLSGHVFHAFGLNLIHSFGRSVYRAHTSPTSDLRALTAIHVDVHPFATPRLTG